MNKRILSLLGILCLLSVLILPASAAVVDTSRTGSISASMTDDGKPVSGGSLTIYRVAEVKAVPGGYGFELVEPYTESGISLEDISSADTADALAEFTRRNRIEGTTQPIGRDGTVTFKNLPLGLYLVMQHEAAPGYFAMNPFLVSLPGNEDGEYIYDVNATPKLELDKAPKPPTEPTKPTETEPTPDDDKLPQTGLVNWPVPVMAVGGIFLILLGVHLCAPAKKKNDET